MSVGPWRRRQYAPGAAGIIVLPNKRTNKGAYDGVHTATGTPNIVIPSDVVPGQLMVAGVSIDVFGGVGMSAPAGWTMVLGSQSAAVFYKIAAAGDPGSTLTIPTTTLAVWDIGLANLSGVNAATPVAASADNHSNPVTPNPSTTWAGPAVTAANPNSLLVTTFAPGGGWDIPGTVTPPAAAILNIDGIGTTVGLGMSSLAAPAAGTSYAGGTCTVQTAVLWEAIALMINPA